MALARYSQFKWHTEPVAAGFVLRVDAASVAAQSPHLAGAESAQPSPRAESVQSGDRRMAAGQGHALEGDREGHVVAEVSGAVCGQGARRRETHRWCSHALDGLAVTCEQVARMV